MAVPNFWDDQKHAQTIIDEVNGLKDMVQNFDQHEESLENLEVSYELVKEEDDQELRDELEEELTELAKKLNQFELYMLLSEPHDKNNAILELHPGAGGTESQDWASLLLRMYTRWAEKHNFKVETLNYLPGDEAGVKNVSLLIKGRNAYGYLKAEKGVHRLVRISPFDSAGRRHTSFASVDVVPELDDSVEMDINPEDLRIDVFRASGAGGQHINKTESAVRITHLPTGIVVSSQAGRSQLKNKEQAMSTLRAKVHQVELEQKEKEMAEIRGEHKEIGWGSQIRSYVFHPYSMVKDHRTGEETGNVEAVMDGELDPFIEAYLRSQWNDPQNA